MDGIPAIYEDGVFKPVGPVSLPEKAEVRVVLPSAPQEDKPPIDPATEVVDQRAVLEKLWADLDSLPRETNGDGWSVANNADDLLYGGPNGPA